MTIQDMNVFVPLKKFNAFTGEFEAVLAEERVDKSLEIMDYTGAKPEFEAWSKMFKDATAHLGEEGQSAGNLRAMHQPISAGKFTRITCDDALKNVTVAGIIVDPVERDKAAKGVYTGLSLGGKYLKRWADPVHKGVTRYVPQPAEGSLVDNPCMYGATFSMIKADGAMPELAKFLTMEERVEQGLLTKTAPELKPQDSEGAIQKWVAQDGSLHDTKKIAEKHSAGVKAGVAVAKLTAPADEALASLAELGVEPNKVVAVYADPVNKQWPLNDERGIRIAWHMLGKGAVAAKYTDDQFVTVAKAVSAAWKAVIDAKGPPEKPVAKADDLKKGFYTLSRVCEIIRNLGWLQDDLMYEQVQEGNDSNASSTVGDILTQLIRFLSQYAAEEAAERAADKDFEGDGAIEGANVIVLAMAANAEMMKLLPEGKLKKAAQAVTTQELFDHKFGEYIDGLGELMTKAGARHSKQDMGRVQTIHDAASALGADCSAEKMEGSVLGKLASSEATVLELTKKVGEYAVVVPDLVARLKKLEDQPAAPKGVIRVIEKGQLDGGTEPAASAADAYKAALAKMTPDERARELMKVALSNPVSPLPAS